MTDSDVDAIAWQFLNSVHPDGEGADEAVSRRLDRFLRHRGLACLAGSGDIYTIILNRVVDYIGVLDRQRGQRLS